MKTGVKICGLTDGAGLKAASDAAADWIGFVFFERSPRFVTPTEAAELIASHEGALPKIVGLFVKASDAQIAETLATVKLDILQLYDTPERARAIKARFGLPVWLSCAVESQDDLPKDTDLDGYVIEPRAPGNASRPGGNGISLDWALLRNWHAPFPWMLAGGLNPDNIAQAIAASHAPAVDVSSGVETAPGCKSPDMIRNFIKNARGTCAPDRN
ncbi:phosphoribosylanthranilate isomerase [Asaia spathodeae]|uniref:N-(5'-phosphoribosyl)anthranilate isomerase n=1 Tax=Asaia spathodeae TaxID=657016 RepID=A0ABX2P8M8_9PROT|nr:phosphoribosylanthranilate isomerase [Asaia spathodeae]GBR15767.1 phosphoribosyl anthranilate isomerase [Asaia spathodeae NBRC 105894]